VTNRLFEINQAAKAITKFTAGAMQTAPNRSHRDIKDGADLLVTMTIEIFQDDYGSMFRAQFVQGVFDNSLAFRPLEREGWVSFGRVIGGIFTRDRLPFPFELVWGSNAPTPVTTQGQVDSNSIDPRVERAISLKLIKFLECANKRVLQDVFSVLGRANEPQDRRVQAFLVASDQGTERLGMARATLLHEAVVVKEPGHHHDSTLGVGG
jgi:hypothetical protein